MKIRCRVLKSFQGSEYGYDVRLFEAGEVADIEETLALSAIADGSVVETGEVAEVVQEAEEKALGDSPEDKAIESAPLNKKKK